MDKELKRKVMDYLSSKIFDFAADAMDEEIQSSLGEMAEDLFDLITNKGVINGN